MLPIVVLFTTGSTGCGSCAEERSEPEASSPTAQAREAQPAGRPQAQRRSADKKRGGKPTQLSQIKFMFKLDPRLTRGLFMGDRWVAPRTYQQTAGGTSLTVGAKAEGVDAGGKLMEIWPVWIARDTKMVTVSPGVGKEVKLTVQRPGSTTVRVTYEEVSAVLDIKARYEDHAIHVEVTPRE